MRNLPLSMAVIAALMMPIGSAQAQSTATVTANCKDGTVFTGTFTGTKRTGACRGHGGACSHGARRPSQRTRRRSREHSLRPPQVSALRPLPGTPVKFG
jgi:hypothetical protein